MTTTSTYHIRYVMTKMQLLLYLHCCILCSSPDNFSVGGSYGVGEGPSYPNPAHPRCSVFLVSMLAHVLDDIISLVSMLADSLCCCYKLSEYVFDDTINLGSLLAHVFDDIKNLVIMLAHVFDDTINLVSMLAHVFDVSSCL